VGVEKEREEGTMKMEWITIEIMGPDGHGNGGIKSSSEGRD
jgi:hypothetical protein